MPACVAAVVVVVVVVVVAAAAAAVVVAAAAAAAVVANSSCWISSGCRSRFSPLPVSLSRMTSGVLLDLLTFIDVYGLGLLHLASSR